MQILLAKHQKDFAKKARPYEGLWHGTGCGKTRTALHAVRDCEGSILVIAPKTTVQKKQWEYEAGVLGMKPPRVISKEVFRRDVLTLPRYKAVIGEEAHYLLGVSPNTRQRKGKKVPKASQLYEAFEWYITNQQPLRVILATATPNKTPMSVWAAARLLGHTIDFETFREEFYQVLPMDLPFGQKAYAPVRDKAAMDKLAKLTRSIGSVLRLNDIEDVPEQVFITKTFEPTRSQNEAISDLPGQYTDESARRAKRHQIENGFIYQTIFDPTLKKIRKIATPINSQKIDEILERADEFEKMIVFANYTEQVNMIAAALKKAGKNVLVLDSRTKDRKALEKEANSAESAYIVAQASISSEWEFPSCPIVIWASMTNKSIDYIQGQGRPQRYKKVKANIYMHLVTLGNGSIDKRWCETIMSGRDFNEALYYD